MQHDVKTNVDVRRAEILDAAAYLFATKGFHATGMRELARHLKIKAGSLYYHISSKDQLLNEVCEIGMKELTLNVDRAIASQGLPETISAIVVGHAALISRYGSYLTCYQHEYIHLVPDVCERMRLELVAFHHKIDDVFRRAVAKGEIRADLHIKNARLATLSILYLLSRLGPEQHQTSLKKTAEGLSEILIYGLVSDRPSSASNSQPPALVRALR